jgi:hypothetical protein
MKKLTFQIAVIAFVAASISLASCSKEGPAGATGPAGPAGPGGAQGPKGDEGTANVIYSEWLDVSYEADTVHDGALIDTIGFITTIDAPKLDNAILTSGEIKAYVNLNSADEPVIAPLPYFSIFDGVSIEPVYYLNSIELYSNLDASTITSQGVKFRQYRYILIPGGVAARKASSVNWNDYNQVKKYLNLKD